MTDAPDLDKITLDSIGPRAGMKWGTTPQGIIPAWIADMDFPIAPEIQSALTSRAANDLGYPTWIDQPPAGPLSEAFAEYMELKHGWRPDPGHVRSYTDINQALQILLHVMTSPGDRVAFHTPGYYPFFETCAEMDRPLLPIPMIPEGDSWRFDLDRLAADLADGRCRVLLLVNPHNPTGRVMTRAELTGLAELAERHDLLVLADEIHADLIHGSAEHIPFATILPERTVTLTSATKAFNLGGIRCSAIHVGVPAVRDALDRQPTHIYGAANLLGVEASVAAWRHGGEWLQAVRTVLDRNRHLVAKLLPEGVGYRVPEATYLAWLDFSALNLGEEPADFLLRDAQVRLSPGPAFGPGGDGFARLNFATSGPILEQMLNRLANAITNRVKQV
ncbi:MalY/PatB family protein [Sinosporangium siamense]|uniref:cysteine-S-conjugate beta-lyase n=1 Tax=Sinosporangium siamense TaxID=1367973 RepID=A0A919RE25_9ACTN|nr:aminotransferase class I/II-fold pyridoxal phosphate-dependent enzyme [Sinosporangium siamense]GII91722.1 aminotransferase [Sinosporangium siamense]